MYSLLRSITVIVGFHFFTKQIQNRIRNTRKKYKDSVNIYLPLNANIGLVLFILEFIIENSKQGIKSTIYIENSYPSFIKNYYVKNFCKRLNLDFIELTNFSIRKFNSHIDYVEALRIEKIINWRIYSKSNKYINNHNRKLFIRINKIIHFIETDTRAKNKWIIPSGIAYSSNQLIEELRSRDIDFITFDSGFGRFASAINGIAAHNKCGYSLFKEIINEKRTLPEKLITKAKKYCEHRFKQNKFQITTRRNNSITYSNYVLILLNIDWDSAAILKSEIGKDQFDSVYNVTNWIIQNTRYNIIIRKHPDERHWWGINKVDYTLVEELSPRIKIIEANDLINTYDLIESSEYVIGWSTSALLESRILQKKTFALAHSLYTDLGIAQLVNKDIVFQDRSLFQLEMPKKALFVLLYLIQEKGWLKNNFTPQDSDLFRRLSFIKYQGFNSEVFDALTDFEMSYIEKYINGL